VTAAATPYGGTPFGGTTNPYASPAPFASSRSAAASQHTHKPKRNGLPWDRRDDDGLFGTAKLVLFSPKEAFYRMHRTGGVGRPLLFCMTGTLIGTLINIGYNLLANLAIVLLAGDAKRMGAALFAMVISTVAVLVVGLPLSIMATVTGSFIYSASCICA
jgi:hypothetical protein